MRKIEKPKSKNGGAWVGAFILVAFLVFFTFAPDILPIIFTVFSQGRRWYENCPTDALTLTPRPTLTPEPSPTCRPAVEVWPTATEYPTGTPYPPQPPPGRSRG